MEFITRSVKFEPAADQGQQPPSQGRPTQPAPPPHTYRFDGTMPRAVLENYLTRAISMEGLLNGRGDFKDNVRMLKATGAKFIGRSLCLWGGEANLLRNLERAKWLVPQMHAADPDMILQACVFEVVTRQVEQVPVPDWAFTALGRPAEKRNFRYADMLCPGGQRQNQWGRELTATSPRGAQPWDGKGDMEAVLNRKGVSREIDPG